MSSIQYDGGGKVKAVPSLIADRLHADYKPQLAEVTLGLV